MSRRTTWLLAGCVVVPLVVALVAWGVWPRGGATVAVARTDRPAEPLFTIPYLDVAAGSAVPVTPGQQAPVAPADQARWITRVAAHTDIPTRALRAYVTAATSTARREPACGITWATLAAVGRTESDHGRHGGDSIGPDGVEASAMIGPALDGSPGLRRVPDTDHGALDGDSRWDHAVGPMQFLPSRWAAQGLRASGDGRPPDPQNIDDAALTAARYLCAGTNLAVPAQWWAAMYRYNNSTAYGRAIFSAAVAYARAAG